jgi:hypothetical protein
VADVVEEAIVAEAAVTAVAVEAVSAGAAEPVAAVEEEDKNKGCPNFRKHPFFKIVFFSFLPDGQ